MTCLPWIESCQCINYFTADCLCLYACFFVSNMLSCSVLTRNISNNNNNNKSNNILWPFSSSRRLRLYREFFLHNPRDGVGSNCTKQDATGQIITGLEGGSPVGLVEWLLRVNNSKNTLAPWLNGSASVMLNRTPSVNDAAAATDAAERTRCIDRHASFMCYKTAYWCLVQ